jgi:hypothetical protein
MESLMVFSEMRCLDKAMNLAYLELLGDAGMINSVMSNYEKVTAEDILLQAGRILLPENCSTLYYQAIINN